MYDDYNDDDLDFLEDELDSYDSEIEGYNDNLSQVADDEIMLSGEYESKIHEIDEYWDRENQYIMNSGIYTKEEVQQILANHEEIRKSKKKDVAKEYLDGLAMIRGERSQIKFDKEMAEYDRECVKDDIEYEHMVRDIPVEDRTYDYILRAKREEEAYDDFIASLDMND